jgi:hypothetical protein
MLSSAFQKSHPVSESHHYGLWMKWTLAVGLGELIGFGVLAVALPLLLAFSMPESILPLAAISFGAVEGAAVGTAQWLVLRRYLPDLTRRAWVLATALAAMWAYALAMIPFQLADPNTLDPIVMVVGGLTLGVLFLLSMGGAQWLVLRRHVPNSGWWVLANAIAWPLGVAAPVVTIALVPDPAPLAATIAAGILGGLLMGIVVGGLTGIVLVRLLRYVRV